MVDQILLLLVSASAKLLLHGRTGYKAERFGAKILTYLLLAILILDDSDLARLIQQVLARDHYLVAGLDSTENLHILIVD